MNSDYQDLLSAFDVAGVEYIVVGAYALSANAVPRGTLDIDVLVRPSPQNAKRVFSALGAFGAPLQSHAVSVEDFACPGNVYQIGLAPRRIDILTRIDGVDFDEAWNGRIEARVGGLVVPFLGAKELVRNKRASGRPKDLLDIELMREAGIDVDA